MIDLDSAMVHYSANLFMCTFYSKRDQRANENVLYGICPRATKNVQRKEDALI